MGMTHGYTSHGHSCCDLVADPRPTLIARCGGPAICSGCATEMNRLFHQCNAATAVDQPDLADPLVFELLFRNHVPAERTIRSTASETAVRSNIICDQDGEAWPCRIKRLLDETDQPSHRR